MLRPETQGTTIIRGGEHDKEMQDKVIRCLRAKKTKTRLKKPNQDCL